MVLKRFSILYEISHACRITLVLNYINKRILLLRPLRFLLYFVALLPSSASTVLKKVRPFLIMSVLSCTISKFNNGLLRDLNITRWWEEASIRSWSLLISVSVSPGVSLFPLAFVIFHAIFHHRPEQNDLSFLFFMFFSRRTFVFPCFFTLHTNTSSWSFHEKKKNPYLSTSNTFIKKYIPFLILLTSFLWGWLLKSWPFIHHSLVPIPTLYLLHLHSLFSTTFPLLLFLHLHFHPKFAFFILIYSASPSLTHTCLFRTCFSLFPT